METLTLRGPGDVAAALPSLLGFPPVHSIVIIAFSRDRIVLTMRVDHPDAVSVGWAHDVLSRTSHSGADSYVFIAADHTFHEEGEFGDAAIAALMEATELEVLDALMVGGRRWRSFLCSGSCCPSSGTEIDDHDIDRIRCAMTLTGHVVAEDREAIRAEFALKHVEITKDEFSELADGWVVGERERLEQTAMRLGTERDLVIDDDVRALVWGCRDARVRDSLLCNIARNSDAVNHVILSNLTKLVRVTEDACVDGIAVIAAVTAWLLGDGARGIDACERACAANPELHFAQLIHEAFTAGLPPSLWRDEMASIRPETCWEGVNLRSA